MSYSVLDLKNDTVGELHGTTSNQVQNFDGVINRAARQLLLELDPQETKRTVEFIAPIYNSVFNYPIASDVKGNKLIDIFPQVQRLPSDIWLQAYNQAFDVAKENIFSLANMFTIDFNSSLKTIRIDAPYLNPPVIINQAESLTSNGTWNASAGANSVSANNRNFVQGAGSIQFNLASVSTNAVMENSTMTPVDLSAYEDQNSVFFWIYIPTGHSSVNGIVFTWGTSSTDNWVLTVSQNQQGTAFVNGWNLLQFDWANATVNGSPDFSSIGYLKVDISYDGTAQTGLLINGFQAILGTILSYEYYSKYLFRNVTTGAYQETVLDDSDLINLDTESFNLLTYQVLYLVTQQQQGIDASYDGGFAKQAYDAGILRYKAMYKSELQKPQSVYYPMPNQGRIINRRWGY